MADNLPEENENNLPERASKRFFEALGKLEIAKEKLIKGKDECLALAITDKESYKVVSERRKEEKVKRVTIQKAAKELRKPYNEAADKIIALENEFVDIIKIGEGHLSSIETQWEIKEAAEKKEKAKREMMRYNKRVRELTHIGVLVSDNRFILDDRSIDGDLVKDADEEVYQEEIYKHFKAIFERHEAERLEKEKLEQERQAKWQQQLREMEEQRAEFAEQQRLLQEKQLELERREQARRNAELQSRMTQLGNLGLFYNQQYDSFVFEDVSVSMVEVNTFDEAAWVTLINKVVAAVTERKAEAEKKKQEEIKQHEKEQEPVPVIDGNKASLAELFKKYPVLNATYIANRIGISDSSMRGYSRGASNPSPERLKQIQTVLREMGNEFAAMGKELQNVTLI